MRTLELSLYRGDFIDVDAVRISILGIVDGRVYLVLTFPDTATVAPSAFAQAVTLHPGEAATARHG